MRLAESLYVAAHFLEGLDAAISTGGQVRIAGANHAKD
jgi:hypothetical protein